MSTTSPPRLAAWLLDLWNVYRAPLLILWCLGAAMIGWIIARMEPTCRSGMLVVCAASQLPFAVRSVAAIWNLPNAGLPFFASFPMMVKIVGVLDLIPLSLCLGGLSANLPNRRPAAEAFIRAE